MGDNRRAEAGVVAVTRDVAVTVGALAAGASADVVLTADAAFKQAGPLLVVPNGAPAAHVVPTAAWVSTPSTGAVTVRFEADAAGYGGGTVDVRISQVT